MEDDLLLEEQIKKKKRLILLLLLTLLLVTAGAAMLLEPAAIPATAVAGVETPTLAEPATPIANSTPSPSQGDEWTVPLTPSPEERLTAPPTVTLIATIPTSTRIGTPTGSTSTPTASQVKNQVEPSPTATSNNPPEIDGDSSATVSPAEGTTVAAVAPTMAAPSVQSSTEVEQSNTAVPTHIAVPAATDISKRINESWDVLDTYVSISGNEVTVYKTGTVTKTLTSTATLSETAATIPPNGLPVTGTIFLPRMNWAALAMVGLLIGAGVMALFHPKILDS